MNDTEADAINKINEIKGSVLSLANKDSLDELKNRCDTVGDEINDILRFQSFEKEAQKIIKEMNDEIKDACRKAERLSCEISSGGHEGVSCNISNPDLSFIKSICDKLAKLLGGLTKDGLIKIVHFFGGKFRPWGAVKWLKWLKAAGPILQTAAMITDGVVCHYLNKKLKAFRSQVSDGLESAKREIRMNFASSRNNADGLIGQLKQLRSEILRPETERKMTNDKKAQLGYWADNCLSELTAFTRDL